MLGEGLFWARILEQNDTATILLLILEVLLIGWIIKTIFSVIGKWKIFKKAGKEGWPALIPIYDTIVLCEITGVNTWWVVITIIANAISGLIPIFGLTLAIIVSIYFKVILYVSTVRSYGRSDAWAVGLYFLRPFFFFALGVGKSKYQGAKPLEDPILETIGINKSTKKEEVKEEKVICKNCGEENLNTSKFCTSCGKKL